jgi:hypothetical protein
MASLPPLQQLGFGTSRWRLQGNATSGLRAGGRGYHPLAAQECVPGTKCGCRRVRYGAALGRMSRSRLLALLRHGLRKYFAVGDRIHLTRIGTHARKRNLDKCAASPAGYRAGFFAGVCQCMDRPRALAGMPQHQAHEDDDDIIFRFIFHFAWRSPWLMPWQACFDRLLFSCFSCSAPAIHPCSFPVVFGTFPGFARVSVG